MTHDEAEGAEPLRRTYLYLRLSLVGAVAAILLAVAFTPEGYLPAGEVILRSISHYYYTPARIVFTAALCAACLALLTLSGPGVQNRLLDLAALLAPLIAVVPTRVLPDELGSAARLGRCAAGWPAGLDCIPADQLDAVALGFAVWAVLSAAVLAIAVAGGLRRRSGPGFWGTVAVGVGILVVFVVLQWSPWTDVPAEGLQLWGHVLAASGFFLLITVVAVIEAFRQATGQGGPPAHMSRRFYAVAYAVSAVTMVVAVGVAVTAVLAPGEWGDAVFWAELVALVAFAVFWTLQTIEHSGDGAGWHAVRLRGVRSRGVA